MTFLRNRRATGVLLGVLPPALALVTWLAVLPARAQNPYNLKPGARGKVCLDCHETLRDTLKLPHVHTPVESGDCADCHNPHASAHGKLLDDDPDKICMECHEDPTAGNPASVHAAVIEGGCTSCHDPHGSENAGNLLMPGEELCGACHDKAEASAAARFGHPPVEDDCLTCHDPHSSPDAPFLLVKTEPELCLDCHDTTGTAFRERHLQYPVDQGRCTSCHDPHGSDQGAMLWANVHPPVSARLCAQCHRDASGPDPLETRQSGLELCRSCHNEVLNEVFAAKQVHWALLDQGACGNCHGPHASDQPALLIEPTKNLCVSCHADVAARNERSAVRHPPVEEGECMLCHNPHSSDNPFLFRAASDQEMCGSCHDWTGHTSHPIGPDVVDPRNPGLTVDCTSCHDPHGTPHDHLTHFDYKNDLCVNCHVDYRR